MLVDFANTAAQVMILLFLIRLIEIYFPDSAVSRALAFIAG